MIELSVATFRTGVSKTMPIISRNTLNSVLNSITVDNTDSNSHFNAPPPIMRRNKIAI